MLRSTARLVPRRVALAASASRGYARSAAPLASLGLRKSTALPTRFSVNTIALRTFAVKVIPVPSMGESITEGSISAWLKEVGDQVEVDEVVCEVATDKVNVEIRSPDAGVIKELFADIDDTVEVSGKLFSLDVGATGGKKKEAAPAPEEPKVETTPEAPKQAPAPPKEAPKKETAPPPSTKEAPKKPAAQPPVSFSERTETRVAMTRMRKRIAERLKASQTTAATLTTFNEIDMHTIMAMRTKYKDEFEKQHGVKLGFMSAFVKAASNALLAAPQINAVIDGDDVVFRNYVDISVAVSSPTGLVVPVLRNVHEMSFVDIERAIAEYGEKAKKGTLALEDMAGGTFTVSNGGVFGSLLSTPIINQPQSAVMGMHAVNQKPWVVDGQIVIRPIMMVAMSYDHRLVDGRESVTFLRHIKRQIEDPHRMLLGL